MVAKRKDAIRIVENGKVKMLRDDYTGKIETVNADLLQMLLGAGYTPVIAPLAIARGRRCAQRGCRPRGGDGRGRGARPTA